MYLAVGLAGLGADEADKWVEAARRTGMSSRFTLPATRLDKRGDPRSSVLDGDDLALYCAEDLDAHVKPILYG